MDDQKFNAIKAEQDLLTSAVPYSAVFPVPDVNSGMAPAQSIEYDEKQNLADEDWKVVKAGYNGLTGVLRGVFGAMSAAVAQNVERHRQQDPNYEPYGGYAPAIAKGLEGVARSSVLTPYNVKGDNAFTQLGLDLIQGGTQLAGQAAITFFTGGLGGAAAMGASIAGNQYLDLRDKGVSVDRAAQAGLENAIFQTPLEQLGVGKVMGRWGLNTATKAKFREIAESAITEAMTETLQQYPEAFTNVWAENEGKSAEEIRDMFLSNLKDITVEGLYSGLIGGILGGAGSAGRLAFDRNFKRQVTLKAQEAQLETMEERIEEIRKSGANPKYAATTINNNLQDEIVYADGETLFQLASERGIEKTASALGTTPEDIVRAAEDGDTVEIRQGDFEAYCSTDQTFFQQIKDDIAFDAGGYTINSIIAEAEMSKEVVISEEAKKEFDETIADVRKQMEVALVPKAQADAWEALLVSRANTYNPEKPAQWFKDHPLQITRNGISSADSLKQTVDVTKTQEFKNWFNGSKILNEEGEPLIVYHGTDADFDVFDRTKTRANMDIQGNFFSPWEIDAQGYGSNVRAFYLSIKNPADSATAYKALNKFKGQNGAGIKAREYLISLGYDGVNNDDEEYIAFYPEQIKAVDNRGTFDPNNPNVYYQKEAGELFNVDLSGNEFGSYQDVKDLRKKAIGWYRSNLQGTTVSNSVLGEIRLGQGFEQNNLAFTGKGRKKMETTGANTDKLLAVKYLKELVENSNYITNSENQKDKHDGKHFYYLHNTITVNGKKQYVIVTVMDMGQSNLIYYNHNVFSEEEYKKIEDTLQEALGTRISSAGQNPQEVSSFNKSITDTGKIYKQQNVYYDGRAKGEINLNEGQAIINLFNGADASTVIHETGHYFVEAMVEDIKTGRANQQMIDDWNALLEYCEVTQEQFDKDGTARRKAHERLAEGFESYIMEGKAPTNKLRKAFSRFAKWLKAVYRKVARNDNSVELTDEVREVFDRMLASEDLIREQQRADGIFAVLPKVITDNLSDKSVSMLADFVEKAREKAELILTKDALKDFAPERKKAIADYKEEWRGRVSEAIEQDPLYAAADGVEDYLGTKQSAKTIARKYKNADGKIYADWQEEKNAVEADINDRLMPIVNRLEAGMGKGVSVIPYGDDASGRGFLASNNDQWYQEWFKQHKRKPNKKELLELAYGVYTGKNDVLGDWSTAAMGYTEAEYAEVEALQAQYTAEIDELIARRDEIIDMKEAVAPFKHLGLTAEQRQNFDAIAETYGFASGEDLANKILESPTKSQAIEARLAEMVKQKFPDVFQERTAAGKAAREALYNNGAAEVVGLELELINEAMEAIVAKEKAEALKSLKVKTVSEEELAVRKRSKEEMAELAKARKQQADVAAKAEFRNLTIAQAIRTDKWIAAERRCAEKAAEAAAKGDLNRAAGYKRQQLYNHACVRESMAVRKRYLQNQKYVQKQFKVKRDTWYREEYFNQAGAILARMGLVRKDYDPRLNNVSLAQFVNDMKNLHDNIAIADWIIQGTVDISKPNSLTLSQYEDVVNALRNIKAMARSAKAVNAFGSKMTFEENKALMIAGLDKLRDKVDPNNQKDPTFWENYVAQNMNASTMFEMIDGGEQGYFYNVIYKRGNECENKRSDMNIAFEDAITKAFAEWLPNREAKKLAGTKFAFDELNGATLNKFELIDLLIYLTTESSSNKLCSMAEGSTYEMRFKGSELFVEGDLNQTRQNLLNFLGKYLTRADYKFAQAKVDACNMYWSELSDLEYRTKGFRPKKEEAYPAIIQLPNGKEIKFTGGYMPLVRDRRLGSTPKGQAISLSTENNINTSGAELAQLHTNTGSTKTRDASVYPIQLGGNHAFGAVRDTITDIAMREYLSDVRRMLHDNELFAKLTMKLGEANMSVFVEHFDAMARPYGGGGYNSFADKVTGGYLGALRKATVHFAIMGKISTTLQNFGNIVLYGGSVEGFGHMDALAAIGNYFKIMDNGSSGMRAVVDTVMAESSFMRERMRVPDISLRDFDMNGDSNIIEEKALKFGTQALVWTDNFTACAVYMQARNKAIQNGSSKEDAILFAEEVIKRTLGSSRRADVASTFRAENLKLFTVFTSFFNTQYNQWLREYRIDRKLFEEGKYAKLMGNVLTFVAAKYIMANALSLLLTGVLPWDDDDEDGYSNLTKSLVSYPFQVGGWQTQAGAVVLQELMGMENYGYRMSPVQSVFDTAYRTAEKAHRWAVDKGELEDVIEPAGNLLAMRFGVPQQISIWIWNGYDFFINDMDFELQDVLRRRPVRER